MTGLLAAVHESACGMELPIPNVRSLVAMEGKADKICSMRVLRILTHSRPLAAVVCSGAKGLLTRRTNSHEDMAFVPCSAAYNGRSLWLVIPGGAEVERKGEPEILIPCSPARPRPGMTAWQ